MNNAFLLFSLILFLFIPYSGWAADIRTYGAACNGEKDDAAAWTAAYADLAAHPSWEVVSMSGGCWSYIGSEVTVNVHSNTLSGIIGQGADLSRIIIGPRLNGFKFNVVSGGAKPIHELLLSGVSIIRSDTSSSSDNIGVMIDSKLTFSRELQHDIVINDVSFAGIAKAYGWSEGAVIKNADRVFFNEIRSYGSWQTVGVDVVATTSITQLASINGYWCEQANICIKLGGKLQIFTLEDYTFAAVNYGVIGNGDSNDADSLESLYMVKPPGYVAAALVGFQFENVTNFDIKGSFFNALDYGANSRSIGIFSSGSKTGKAYGNNFYMTPNGSATCVVIGQDSLDVDVQGGTCDNAKTGFIIAPTALRTKIQHVLINDIKDSPILNSGVDSVTSPNNINGVIQ